jgi:hypothetical protein
MFRQLAKSIPGGAPNLFLQHPSVLSTTLEVAWQFRIHDPNPAIQTGDPRRRSNIPQLPGFWLNPLSAAAGITPPPGAPPPFPGSAFAAASAQPLTVFWEHLIYAYMIENTRIYEIFRRVLQEFLFGEKLGAPSDAATQQWLRNTEELFYRDPPPFSITSLTSYIRPDLRATRRNAYWRMFGMDLNHGSDDGQPYAYIKPDAFNNEFGSTFEEFLREAWIAISNRNNTSGSNPTDPSKLENYAQNLQTMLLSRRLQGNLSREEFVFVSMMSWFHLTVDGDFPIIQSLKAEAASPEQRLFKIAQRVGLPAHGLSKSFFDIADPISRILILIEVGAFNTLPPLGTPTFNSIDEASLRTIITHWTSITGHDVKAGKVAVK